MVKRGMKIIGCLLLSVVLLCSLTACTKKEKKVQVLDDTEDESVYLSIFSADSMSESDAGKYWSDCFSKQYNKKVYVNYDGAAYYADEGLSYRELLEKRLKSNDPDDLYVINAEDVIDFEKKGYWMDLSNMDFVDNLSDAALYQSTYNGKVFSVPLTFTGFGFYWNVDMLKKYGLKIPENLTEFEKVCKRLKAEGIVPYGANKGYALTVAAMCKGLAKLYGSSDQEQRIQQLNDGEAGISTYMEEGFEFLSWMIDKGYMDPEQALETEPGKEKQEFLEGKYAFICTTLEGAILQQKSEKRKFQTELTGIPALDDRSIAVYGANSRLCVNPKSKNLDTAKKFVEMVGTQEALNKSAELENAMSSAKKGSTVALENQKKLYNLLRQEGQIPNQDFSLYFNTWESIRDVSREICDGITVKEACKKLDQKQQAELNSKE